MNISKIREAMLKMAAPTTPNAAPKVTVPTTKTVPMTADDYRSMQVNDPRLQQQQRQMDQQRQERAEFNKTHTPSEAATQWASTQKPHWLRVLGWGIQNKLKHDFTFGLGKTKNYEERLKDFQRNQAIDYDWKTREAQTPSRTGTVPTQKQADSAQIQNNNNTQSSPTEQPQGTVQPPTNTTGTGITNTGIKKAPLAPGQISNTQLTTAPAAPIPTQSTYTQGGLGGSYSWNKANLDSVGGVGGGFTAKPPTVEPPPVSAPPPSTPNATSDIARTTTPQQDAASVKASPAAQNAYSGYAAFFGNGKADISEADWNKMTSEQQQQAITTQQNTAGAFREEIANDKEFMDWAAGNGYNYDATRGVFIDKNGLVTPGASVEQVYDQRKQRKAQLQQNMDNAQQGMREADKEIAQRNGQNAMLNQPDRPVGYTGMTSTDDRTPAQREREQLAGQSDTRTTDQWKNLIHSTNDLYVRGHLTKMMNDPRFYGRSDQELLQIAQQRAKNEQLAKSNEQNRKRQERAQQRQERAYQRAPLSERRRMDPARAQQERVNAGRPDPSLYR